MFVLIAYDVEAGRTEKFRKVLSRYLVHEQNSVFSGELTAATLLKLHKDLSRIAVKGDHLFQIEAENRHNVSISLLKMVSGNATLQRVAHNHHTTDATIL